MNQKRQNKEYLTVRLAAKMLGVTPSWVRKMINRGKIKADKMDKYWLIPDSNLEGIHRKRQKKEIKHGSSK